MSLFYARTAIASPVSSLPSSLSSLSLPIGAVTPVCHGVLRRNSMRFFTSSQHSSLSPSAVQQRQQQQQLPSRLLQQQSSQTAQSVSSWKQATMVSLSQHTRFSSSSSSAASSFSSREPTQPRQPHPPLKILHGSQPSTATTTTTTTKPCWSCPAFVSTHDLFCKSCQVVVKPNEKATYFELFHLPVSFDIDPAVLEKAYRQLQWKLHPDKFSRKTKTEQDLSAQHSANVNKAYDALKSPLHRAQYLLKLKGFDVEEGEKSDSIDAEFLMYIMEANEQLEGAENEEEVKQIAAENSERKKEAVRELSGAFASNDLSAAKTWFAKLKYLTNVEHAAHHWTPQAPTRVGH